MAKSKRRTATGLACVFWILTKKEKKGEKRKQKKGGRSHATTKGVKTKKSVRRMLHRRVKNINL